MLDTISQYHGASQTNSGDDIGPDVCMEGALTPEDAKTLRGALLSLVKYFIVKDVNVKEVTAILGFISTVKEEPLVIIFLIYLGSFANSNYSRSWKFLTCLYYTWEM